MISRDGFARSNEARAFSTPFARTENAPSNIPLFLVAALCLLVPLGVLWSRNALVMFPEASLMSQLGGDVSESVPALTSPHADPSDQVTRAVFVSDEIATPVVQLSLMSDTSVSQQLRRPVRLVGTDLLAHDLRGLVAEALAVFGHAVSDDDALQSVLVTTLSQGQSDAYIDAALNSARLRGEFQTPPALRTVSGKLDTQALLKGVLMVLQDAPVQYPGAHGGHILSSDDSLAGLALRYYGRPSEFSAIAAANVPLAKGMSFALHGARIEIPAL